MSSVNGVNGLNGNLYEILMQSVKGSNSVDSTTSIAGMSAIQGTTNTNQQGIDNLRDQIDTAISEALSGLDKSSSLDEIKSAVQEAVNSTLEANGIDPGQIQGQLPPPPPPPPAELASNSSSTSNSSDEDEDEVRQDPFLARLEEILNENGFDGESIISQLQSEMSGQSPSSIFSLMQNIQSQQGIDKTV